MDSSAIQNKGDFDETPAFVAEVAQKAFKLNDTELPAWIDAAFPGVFTSRD